MRIAAALLLMMTASSALSSPTDAATTSVPFTSTVLSTCVLTVGTPGVLAPNSDYTVLDSQEAGGTSSIVTVTSTGASYSVSTDAPSSFNVAPTGGNDNLTFEASYQGTGATTIGSTLGTVSTLLGLGLTTVTLDLKATKSTGVFPQGAYTTEVVVRCE
ncbi:MAG: hypothetical protein KDJ47_18670 [Hyphomicrobiaceae bacterium]|nr:hypothetical protein [Hyphomicrobiaceae bacterium]